MVTNPEWAERLKSIFWRVVYVKEQLNIVMKRILLIALIIFITTQLFSQEHANYANHSVFFVPEKNTTRLFLDKNGDFYPEETISYLGLDSVECSLIAYFRLHNDEFIRIAERHNLELANFSEINFRILQDSIVSRKLTKLHSVLDDKSGLFVLIHGFRKHLVPAIGDITAHEEYTFMKAQINKNSSYSTNQFLEIYWDGMYLKPERSLKFAFALGKMFKKQSFGNATETGIGLRKFISEINRKEITLISHSLGAEVMINLLFNARRDCPYPTPSQGKINACMIAAAISKKPFKNYYNRTTQLDHSEKDNYQLSIIYNKKDFVLSKSTRLLGVRLEFSRLYGNTRLGCNCRGEATELEKKFERKFPNSSVRLIHADSFGASHRSKSYSASEEFKMFIESIH